MSKAEAINAVVHKTIALADREGFVVKFVDDGEEILFTTVLTTRTEVVNHATGVDECRIVFWDDSDQFTIYFAFDNEQYEMIYDHTDNEVANAVASEVHDYFVFN